MRIGLDLDEPLFPIIDHLILWWNERYQPKIEYEKITKYNWYEIKEFKVTKKEVMERIFDFYRWEGFEKIKPKEDAKKGIEMIANHELIIITARPEWMKEKTEKWVKDHFPQIKKVYLTNEYGIKGKKEKKSKMCRDLRIEQMVEDKLETAIETAFAGIKTYLIKRPWNIKERYPDGIIMTKGMQETAGYINKN